MKDIAIYGAGGFGREVACLIRQINEFHAKPIWNFVGYFDDRVPKGTILDYGVVLGDDIVLNFWAKEIALVIAIGSTKSLLSVSSRITNKNVEFPNIISPYAIFLDKKNFRAGVGNVICSQCVISTNVIVGNFNMINVCVPIGHDVSIGSCNVIMPNVNISGAVTVGNANFFGVKSTVLQCVKIGNDTTIGCGSVVMRKTKDGKLYFGNPADIVEF